MRLSVSIQMPLAESAERDPKMSLEEQVRDMIECIKTYAGEHDKEWFYLRRLYKHLQSCKKTEKVQNLMSMIEPILSEYGMHGVTGDLS